MKTASVRMRYIATGGRQVLLDWFKASKDNNIVYTSYNEKENKDVYMVALRNESGELIAYYEKHEYRNRETMKMYNMD